MSGKALIVVAQKYNGHELWVTLGVLQKAGIGFYVLSQNMTIFDEITGFKVHPNDLLHNFNIDDIQNYNALIFISGNMKDTERYWRDPHAQILVRKALDYKLNCIAAICCSVPAIREATKGLRATYFPLNRSRDLLKEAGAILSTRSVEVDGYLVTAENQMVTQTWVEYIVKVMLGEPVEITTVEVGDITKTDGKNRKPGATLDRLRRTSPPKE